MNEAGPKTDWRAELIDSRSWVRRRAACALAKMPHRAKSLVPLLIEALADKDPRTRYWVEEALGQVGHGAVARLTDVLVHRRRQARAAAARVLARLGSPARPALPVLQAALKDRDQGVRCAAARALQSIQTRAGV